MTADSNIDLSDTPPAEYMPLIEDNYPGALANQFIPFDPYLWKIENFRDFLSARRELISMKINEYMDSLIAEPVVVYERSIAELASLGESATLEFKSSLQWDVVQNAVNKELRNSSLKTIAAFLNSSGGTLGV